MLAKPVVQYRRVGRIMSLKEVFPNKDFIEINIDKLIPYGNYPLENIKGRPYDEFLEFFSRSKNEAKRVNQTYPILVRQLPNENFEVLDGNVRFAVCKKLKIKTMFALDIGTMTSEEAAKLLTINIPFVSFPFDLLANHNVNIYRQGYIESVVHEIC